MSQAASLPEFVARWQASALTEKSAAQTHFIELCQVLGMPWPSPGNPLSAVYAFEKGVGKTGGGKGFADVWLRGHFAWEYKAKGKDLGAAYEQLLRYREDLANPPLLVVCDLDRFEVHTNFTNTAKRVYKFALSDLVNAAPTPTCPKSPLEVLHALWDDPERLRPEETPDAVTRTAAAEFALLAESLRSRGEEPEAASRFLIRLLFCLFAEDVGLLPAGLFTRLVTNLRGKPAVFAASLRQLFAAMAQGGFFGADVIAHFNGGLFADDDALALSAKDLETLERACRLDWRSIEPAIFGTLFERSLDPAKRSQLGAHYTGRDDIGLIVEPVLMVPLRRCWDKVKAQVEELVARREEPELRRLAGNRDRGAVRRRDNIQAELTRLLVDFQREIASVQVLDPACGSGNFLYVALKELLDLEKEVIVYSSNQGAGGLLPQVGPGQLYGIELDPYAHELAQASVYIGYIQWLRDNGFGQPSEPILQALDNIRQMDAILAFDEEGKPYEPEWPEADIIIGNPPFLGGSKLRRELGEAYIAHLWSLYSSRIPNGADLVTYWFERARTVIAAGKVKRAGLLATQSIRGERSRSVLERIKQSGDIFLAHSDRPWVLDGAAVRVSMIGFDDGKEQCKTLDGVLAAAINANLTGSLDLTRARHLKENSGLHHEGTKKGAAFEIPRAVAATMLADSGNPNGRPNSDVVHPWANGADITGRPTNTWIIDFGTEMSVADAALYQAPFTYIEANVRPKYERTRRRWWLHERPRPDMRLALASLSRYIATPRVAKHRLFVTLDSRVLPDSRLAIFARDDDYFLGVLHSRPHEVWSLATSSRHGDGTEGGRPTYNGTTCFETYPFPWPPGKEPQGNPRVEAIAEAARELVEKRDRWLNPVGASEADLKKRTLTNLYNERPTWLALAHEKLNRAVLDAYGWPHDLSDEELLERLLALNLERAA